MMIEPYAVNQKIEMIDLKKIGISNYQRPISQSRANKIAASFDPAKLGVLIVSRQLSGEYTILDGQHRLSAMRLRNMDRGMAIVLENMTREQEADYFRRQNENSTSLNCYDLYNAGLVARDPHFVAIEGILHKYGYVASRQSGPMHITAVSALSRIVVLFGLDVLDRAFSYITTTWPTDSTVLRREMLAGIADFVTRFGRSVEPEMFAERMSNVHPSALFYEYRRRTECQVSSRNAFNLTMRYTLTGILVESYNKGLNSNSRKRLKLDWNAPVFEYDGGGKA